MIQNPRNPNPIENEDPENEPFGSDDPRDPRSNPDLDEPIVGRRIGQEDPLAGDDLTNLDDTVAELGDDESEGLDEEQEEGFGSGEEHERIPDRTQDRNYR